MPPKTAAKTDTKSSKSAKKHVSEDAWRPELESVLINDNHWWCMICMIVETLPEHSQCLGLFNEAAEDGRRKAVYALSYQNMMKNLRIQAKPDLDKCPLIQGVCHFVNKQIIEEGEKYVSTWLMARVIKYFVYRAKMEDVVRCKQETQLESEITKEIRIMHTVAHVPGMGAKPLKPVKSPKKGGGGGGGSESSKRNKALTKLRKRGEEWRDKVCIDDAPESGPNLYIVISGFYDPALPIELIKAGIPLTCILKIHRPGERMENLDVNTLILENRAPIKRTLQLGNTSAEVLQKKLEIHMFWEALEKNLKDWDITLDYCCLICQTFCPPKYGPPKTDWEYQMQKSDMYQRVAYILYDLYDIERQHSSYIKNMKLQPNLAETRPENQETGTYTEIMDAIPSECSTVPMILHALLVQVEAYFPPIYTDPKPNEISEKPPAEPSRLSSRPSIIFAHRQSISKIRHPSFADRSFAPKDRQLQKIVKLNKMYEIYLKQEPVVNVADPCLILHGDTMEADTYHFHLEGPVVLSAGTSVLSEMGMRVMRQSRIAAFWDDIPEQLSESVTKYAYHLHQLSRCYNQERMDNAIVRHYIHILLLEKMIYGERPHLDLSEGEDLERRVSFPDQTLLKLELNQQRTISETSAAIEATNFSDTSLMAILPAYFWSDSNIDYLRTVKETFECPLLFALIDTREMVQPGFLKSIECRRENIDSPPIEEYDSVQLLSPSVFLQTIHDCFQEFDVVEHKYFEPTDSILLYCHNVFELDGTFEQDFIASIRTPVCIRDFCEYVINEEDEWIRQEDERHREELHQNNILRDTKEYNANSHNMDLLTQFTDADFILPNSLKAEKARRDLAAGESGVKSKGKGKDSGRKEDRPKKEQKEKKVKSPKTIHSAKKAKPSEIDTSFLPLRKISSSRCAKEGEPYHFIGYDLGNYRVQVSGVNGRFFSVDGTLVEVCLEEWLYAKTQLHIAITLGGSTLSLYSFAENPPTVIQPLTFHLVTKDGIIMAFSKLPAVDHTKNESGQEEQSKTLRQSMLGKDASYQNNSWVSSMKSSSQGLGFEFRASWPSGLIVETLIGDILNEPFYVKQTYISKGPECSGIIHESYRKFLRNGTILKFLDDDTVCILRPNGTIITCTAFEKLRRKDSDNERSEKSTPRARSKAWRSSRASVMSRASKLSRGSKTSKIKRKSSNSRKVRSDDERLIRPTLGSEDLADLLRTSLNYEEMAGFKILSYTVLEPEGRHYEVYDGHIVEEFEQELVRTASDHEVGERFTRRADGTNTLINSKGSQIVAFPGGDRITTSYVIEDDEVFCDWTEDEFILHYLPERQQSIIQLDESTTPLINGSSQIPTLSDPPKIGSIKEEMLSSEGYVSIRMTCRMEHKNYATVIYNQSESDCTLLMPGSVQVCISRQRLYRINTDNKTNLQVKENSLEYSSNICATCGGVSNSTYNLEHFMGMGIPNTPLLTTKDMLGNVFTVDYDGKTAFKRAKQSTSGRQDAFNAEYEGSGNGEDEEEWDRRAYESPYCLPPEKFTKRGRYRLFAMNRDFTAYEYLHRSSRYEQEKEVCCDDNSSMLFHPASGLPGLQYSTTLSPPNPKTLSKAWLQPYVVLKVIPTNFDRTDLLRSTYSIPYDWLFPFGKNGNGIWKTTWDVPLKDRLEESVPDHLRIRILQAIERQGENIIINLQIALGCYWQKVINLFEEYHTYSPDAWRSPEGREVETWLYNLAMGHAKTIEIETYRSGLAKNRIKPRPPVPRSDKHLQDFLNRRKLDQEEIAWYKMCMRNHLVPPYFINIPGACFLWVLECADKAFDIVEAKLYEARNFPCIALPEEFNSGSSVDIFDHVADERYFANVPQVGLEPLAIQQTASDQKAEPDRCYEEEKPIYTFVL